ncbi:MAG: gephyrin-like molybdotransferase Glp [Desulfovibrionaceae bacterium]
MYEERVRVKGFFNVVSVDGFVGLLRTFAPLGGEDVPLGEADGRVLSRAVAAREDLPLRDRSCMDGFAVRARDVFGAGEANPSYLEQVGAVGIETEPAFEVGPGECAAIVTGGLLPRGADAVVMVEHTHDMGAGAIEIRTSQAPHDNVMLRGEDAAAGAEALPAGCVLRPQEIGLLAALGYPRVPVFARPRVGIVSTGDELIPVEATPVPGQVRDVNSATLYALARRAGAEATCFGLVPDNAAALKAALAKALESCDVVFLSGGSSVGVRDFTLGAIEAMPDADILAHGVALSPGKPTILCRVGRKAVWGLPGQVTSAMVVMQVLALPFLRYLQGEPDAFSLDRRVCVPAVMARNAASKPGREDFVRVRLEQAAPDGGLPRAVPLFGKSGLLGTMLRAHGLVRIPAEAEGVRKGAPVSVWLA